MPAKNWVLPPPMPEAARAALSDYAPVVAQLLFNRGYADPTAARAFLAGELNQSDDPSGLVGLPETVDRLRRATTARERIAIYGDYDTDGVTATVLLVQVLAALGADILPYIPKREDEGYGLNTKALSELREQGASLVVSVDCGVRSLDEADHARRIGLDLIITDHHNPTDPQGPIPEALAVVHPRLAGSSYPFGDLCGAGVAFKLAWRLATLWCGSTRVGKALQEHLLNMLPLAALGTIADVMPLVGENRTIASWGLRLLKSTPLVGLRALIEASGLEGEEIDSEKAGFVLAPRLNAIGRLGHAAAAVRLLTDAPPVEAAAIARRLTLVNRHRQETERQVAGQASRQAAEAGMTGEGRRAVILADESWHAGVLGIVCSRLAEQLGRPVVLLQRQGDLCKGSARSVEGYSIYEGLAAVSVFVVRFGGHDAAAGLELRTQDLPAFTEALTAHANERIGVEDLTPALRIDCDATIGELDLETVGKIADLSPFGRANPRPALRLRSLTVAGPPRAVGANGRHLTLTLRSQSPGENRWIRGVWFGAGDLAPNFAAGVRLDAVVEPKINAFNGLRSVEAELRDVLIHQGT